MKRLLFSRRGDLFAWTASVLVVVALPLMSLSIDVVRMMYMRGHLQTANDAACQAAADALDVPVFISSGTKRINPALARRQAAQVFSATLSDDRQVGFNHRLAVAFPKPTFAHCTASANVSRLISFTPPMRIVVETTSEMRVSKKP